MNARAIRAWTLMCAVVVAASGCRQARDFLPRTHTTSLSPDGRYTAFVRQGLNIDPPDDHLFLAARGGPSRPLMALAPDADWCTRIAWTSDSRKVGFVVADDRLALFNAETGILEAFFFLAGTGCCGGPQDSRNVTLNGDGTEVSFDRFDRTTVLIRPKDGNPFNASLTRQFDHGTMTTKWPVVTRAANRGREVVRVPAAHVRLRLVAANGDAIPSSIFVNVVSKDQRSIGVHAAAAADGVVTLPATDDGPLDRLEIGFKGLGGRRIMVRDVRAGGAVKTVDIPPGSGI
jgi:hypothetical protein